MITPFGETYGVFVFFGPPTSLVSLVSLGLSSSHAGLTAV